MNDAVAPVTPTPRAEAVATEWVLVAIGLGTFVGALVVTYRPTGDDVVMAAMPWILLAGMVAAMSWLVVSTPLAVRVLGTAVMLAAWAVLIFDDDRWSIASFGIYFVCYAVWGARPVVAVGVSGVATAIWIAGWFATDAPAWTAIIPLAVFGAGSGLAFSIYRAESLNQEQKALIEQLRETQADLAESERSKGVLEERARMAGEIHDTLAQGFTSIVLLSRAARRSGADFEQLSAIEKTAKENLDASRRLIDAMRPPELEAGSLRDAVGRHVSSVKANGFATDFGVVGTPRPLPGTVEVAILRATQELTANVVAHANARRMDVTLSYLDDAVELDVRDDGVGFAPGTVSDRGSLTGGQGLDALCRRAESLGGQLAIASGADGGSVLSLSFPAGEA